MKKLILCLSVTYFLVLAAAMAQSGWKKISPVSWVQPVSLFQRGPGNQMLALSWDDKNTVTIDGVNWQNTVMQNNRFETPVYAAYASQNVVYAGFYNGITGQMTATRKSTDGGKSWTVDDNGEKFTEMDFAADGQTGYAMGFNSSQNRVLKKTTDQGATWTIVSDTPINYTGLEVTGINEIWAGDGQKVVKSTNGGQTWTIVNIGNTDYIRPPTFNGQFGYTFYDAKIFTTTNGGNSWNTINAPSSVYRVFFLDAQTGWAQGNLLYKTTNGGVTWQSYPINNAVFTGNMYFNADNQGWNMFNDGIKHTTDGGQTWKSQAKISGEKLAKTVFQGKRAWVAGADLAYSDNNGKTWTTSPLLPSLKSVLDITFRDSLHGVIVGQDNLVATSDGGNTWQSRAFPSGLVFNARFLNENVGSVWGSRNLYITTNGGQTWTESPIPAPTVGGVNAGNSPRDVQFLSENVGYAGFSIIDLGGGGPNPPPFEVGMAFLYKTTDGGASWQVVDGFEGDYFAIERLAFADAGHGVVTRYGSTIRHTNNGGNSFTDISIDSQPGNFWPSKVVFANDTVGIALVSKEGKMYKTTNARATWVYQGMIDSLPDTLQTLQSIAFQNAEPVLAVGDGGVVYANQFWTGTLTRRYATGRIVKKENEDCIQDANEIPLPGRIVRSEPGMYYTSTNAAGTYAVLVDTGAGLVRELIPYFLPTDIESQYCPPGNAPHAISVTEDDDTLKNKDFINETTLCPLLVINQIHTPVRPCRRGTLTIQIRNLGTISSDSEWVHVQLPPALFYFSANRFADFNATDSTYRFRIPPLQPNAGIIILIQDSVLCSLLLDFGQTICIKTFIPNVPACMLASPGWDGADLEVASKCIGNQTKFTIRNKGAAMANTSQYRIFVGATLAYQAPFQLIADGQMTVTTPPEITGNVRLEVSQTTNHPLSSFAAAEANCETGESTNGMFPPPDESPLVDIECATILNAIDPNDKLVFPTGWGAAGNVEPETEFKYTIRFQNTGNDTAFKVVLVDTLDANLDIASFQNGISSHPHVFTVSGKGKPVLTWTFDNILLPDSGTNQLASNGFITFSIRPKADLALGTRLENFADIYFDFNAAVRTNTTVNTLWRPTLIDGIIDTVFITSSKKVLPADPLSIYPNPTKGKLKINVPDKGQMQLYTLLGELVMEKPVEKGGNELNLSGFPKGIYVARFGFAGFQEMRKVMVE